MGLKVFGFQEADFRDQSSGSIESKNRILVLLHEEFNTVSPSFFVVTFRRAFSTRVRAR
jgi:hypothetical protein